MFYLTFVQIKSPFEGGQQIDAMRKTFHRAICIPMDQIEHIWKDYDAFENQLNKMTVRDTFHIGSLQIISPWRQMLIVVRPRS
jgi:hypothetical protein